MVAKKRGYRPRLAITNESRELFNAAAKPRHDRVIDLMHDAVYGVRDYEATGKRIDWYKIYGMKSSEFGVTSDDALAAKDLSVNLQPDAIEAFNEQYEEISSAFPDLEVRGPYSKVVTRLMVRAWWLIEHGRIGQYVL